MPGTTEATPWLQFQLSLAPPKPVSQKAKRPEEPAPSDWVHARQMVTARHVGFAVLRALAPLRRAGVVQAAHFQRKEPGLRWRIASDDETAVVAALSPVLDRLCEPGQGLATWTQTVYEPETYLFGGAHAVQAIQTLFDADTAAWSQLDALRRRGHLPYTDAALALGQVNSLFSAALGGRPEEVWDAWCRLAAFHGLRPPVEAAEKRSRPTLSTLAAHPQAAVARKALQPLANAQHTAGAALAELAFQGQLTQGLRGVLAAVALFGWNRIGLTPAERRHVLVQAMGAWHPHAAPLPPVAASASQALGQPRTQATCAAA